MTSYDRLLYPVFEHLRRHGVPIGVSEYLDVVASVRQGVGLESVGHLRRFCRLLWAKSQEDQELFDIAFAQWVEPRLRTARGTQLPEPPSNNDIPEKFPEESAMPEPTPGKEEAGSAVEPVTTSREAAQQNVLQLGLLRPRWDFEMDAGSLSPRYQLTPRFPLGRREMSAAWRHLRRLQRVGPPEELDVETTIQDISKTGLFLGPALRPRRRNQARLVVLVDRSDSMAPFAPLVDVLIEAILHGGLLGQTHLYYFHDCPESLLYAQPALTGVLPLQDVLTTQAKGNGVLIVSDAGSARGYYDEQRLRNTGAFLQALSLHTYTYAWLNPVPPRRWTATTAQDIARSVPMFPLSRDGLGDIVNILRGQPFPQGVNPHGG